MIDEDRSYLLRPRTATLPMLRWSHDRHRNIRWPTFPALSRPQARWLVARTTRENYLTAVMATTMLCPGCSGAAASMQQNTNEQTPQLAKHPICRRPQRGSLRSFRASYQPRG